MGFNSAFKGSSDAIDQQQSKQRVCIDHTSRMEMEVELHKFLILTLDKGELPGSQPGHLTLGKGRPLLVSQKDGWAPRWRKENRHPRRGPRLKSLVLQPERLHYRTNNYTTALTTF
jgi:hypothetical protein